MLHISTHLSTYHAINLRTHKYTKLPPTPNQSTNKIYQQPPNPTTFNVFLGVLKLCEITFFLHFKNKICTPEEKNRIAKRANSAGKNLSEFAREMLLNGKVVAPSKFTELQEYGIALLHDYVKKFTLLGNFLKSRDGRLYAETERLIDEIKDVIRQFFIPKTKQK